MDSLKLYLRSMRMYLRARLNYPRSFVLQTLSQLVMLGGELLAVLLIIDRFGALGRWSGGDLLFFFGFLATAFYICECFFRGVTCFPPLVRTGRLDTFFLRPRGILTQALCAELDARRMGAILIGVAALVAGAKQAGVVFTGLKVLCLFVSLVGACALILGLFLIEATLSVFSVQSIEIVNALTYGGRSACQYPIDIYPKPLRILFTFVAPFALTTHIPASYILDKPMFNGSALVAFLTPLAGLCFFFLSYLLFLGALRHYRSTGS